MNKQKYELLQDNIGRSLVKLSIEANDWIVAWARKH